MIGPELDERPRRVSEGEADDRDAGGARGEHVGLAIAHHDRALERPPHAPQCLAINGGVRLRHADRVGADDRAEVLREVESLEQSDRETFELVRAYAEPDAARGELAEERARPRKWLA